MMRKLKVLIHPGIFENKLHCRRLVSYLESLSLSVEVHKCWSDKADIENYLHISHSGGFLCSSYQNSKLTKLNFAPPTVSELKIILELPIKVVKDFKIKDFKLSLLKVPSSLVEMLKPFYWLRMIRAYIKFKRQGFKFSDNELVIASPSDGFCNIKIIKTAPRHKIISGSHDEVLDNPARFNNLFIGLNES